MERAVVAIGTIHGKQLLGLLVRLWVHVALDEDLGIIKPSRVIIRRQIEHRLQQQLRIVEYVPPEADARE